MRAPLSNGTRIKARLQQVVGDLTVLWGTNSHSSGGGGGQASVIEGRFTIPGTTTFEFQDFCNGASGVRGSPFSLTGVDELYATVQLYRVTNPPGLAGLSEWMMVVLCGVLLMAAYGVSKRASLSSRATVRDL